MFSLISRPFKTCSTKTKKKHQIDCKIPTGETFLKVEMEKFGIVKLNNPRNPQEPVVSLPTLSLAEQIRFCKMNDIPVTDKNGIPLDSAEIQYVLFHEKACLTYAECPSKELVREKWNRFKTGLQEGEITEFLRAWIDVEDLLEVPEEIISPENLEQFPQADLIADISPGKNSCNGSDGNYSEVPSNPSPNSRKRKCCEVSKRSEPSFERKSFHNLLEMEPVGTVIIRPSSLQRVKSSNCTTDFYVITQKVSEGKFKDDLLVKECGRGWTITSAKIRRGNILLDPVREFFPCFFDVLTNYLSKFSLNFGNIRTLTRKQVCEIYNQTISKKRKEN